MPVTLTDRVVQQAKGPRRTRRDTRCRIAWLVLGRAADRSEVVGGPLPNWSPHAQANAGRPISGPLAGEGP